MIKLQKPKFVYMNGRLRAWEDAVLHVSCEAATRGLNVFEGVKGYWQADGRFSVVMPRQHYERLQRSARLLYLPFEMSLEQYEGAMSSLASELLDPDSDMWFRTTLFATEGLWGEGTVADLVVTAYQAEKRLPELVDLGISTWRRSVDVALPPRIKSGTNYQVGRLAKIEGRARGCNDMILLNQEGRVAETTVACVMMVRNGTIYTPPPSEGALESITVDVLEALAGTMGIPFVRRPIDRTELLVADELALCGTLTEVALVRSMDGFRLPDPKIFAALQARYLDAVRGVIPHPAVVCGPIRLPQSAGTAHLTA